MKISWRYLGCSLAVVLALAIGLLNRAVLHTYVVEPFARMVWLAGRTFMAVDQALYWAALVLAVLIVGLLMASAGQAAPPRTSYRQAARPVDRLAYWQTLLEAANDDADARRKLESELENLAQSIEWAADEKDPGQPVHLPPVRRGLGRVRKAVRRAPFVGRLRRGPSDHLEASLQMSLAPILQAIEKKMEITHEPSTGDHAGD